MVALTVQIGFSSTKPSKKNKKQNKAKANKKKGQVVQWRLWKIKILTPFFFSKNQNKESVNIVHRVCIYESIV